MTAIDHLYPALGWCAYQSSASLLWFVKSDLTEEICSISRSARKKVFNYCCQFYNVHSARCHLLQWLQPTSVIVEIKCQSSHMTILPLYNYTIVSKADYCFLILNFPNSGWKKSQKTYFCANKNMEMICLGPSNSQTSTISAKENRVAPRVTPFPLNR